MLALLALKRIALVSTLLVVLISTFLFMKIPKFHSDLYNLSEYKTIKKSCSGKQLILLWTKFFESDDFHIGLGSKPFMQCKTSGCCVTNNRNFFDTSAAIIFHIRDLDLKDMPPHRSANQRWIFFLQESPHHTPNILYDLNNIFNWTMTYRTDSDIYMPYPVLEPTAGSSFEFEIWNKTFEPDVLKDQIRQKKKLAAWFVSNCFTQSGREKYASELQKYVHVDVYGKCGPLVCANHLQCYQMLEQQYKFYLSFENSICRDYVTGATKLKSCFYQGSLSSPCNSEKFYNALLFNVVPVVYGGANYNAVAPKGSYIDVRDFTSVRHLAQYLKFLDKNDSAYLRYFDWRKTPSSISALPRFIQGWCTLCSMLNNTSLPLKSYSNIHSWWFEKGHCENDRTNIHKLTT